MNNLSKKIQDTQCPVILYELIPPVQDVGHESTDAYIECAASLLNSTSVSVDGINLPEIRSEDGNGTRTYDFAEKLDPRTLTKSLKKPYNYNNFQH